MKNVSIPADSRYHIVYCFVFQNILYLSDIFTTFIKSRLNVLIGVAVLHLQMSSVICSTHNN